MDCEQLFKKNHKISKNQTQIATIEQNGKAKAYFCSSTDFSLYLNQKNSGNDLQLFSLKELAFQIAKFSSRNKAEQRK